MRLGLWQRKEKGSTLQIVLVVGVLISILLLSMFQLLLLRDKLYFKREDFKRAVREVNYVFDLMEDVEVGKNLSFPLEDKSLHLRVGHWGLYELVDVSIAKNNVYFQKIGLQGGRVKRERAVYLENTNSPLLLAGKTKITGDVFLSKEGLKEAYINNAFYQAKKLLVGNIKESRSNLLKFENRDCMLHLQKQIDSMILYGQDSTLENHILVNSFKKPTFLYKDRRVDLQDVKLDGNIIIVADSSITVHSDAKLNGVLLVAPAVYIKSGVEGSFQVFANKKIQVEKNTYLKYPSVLFLDSRELSETEQAYINVEKNVNVEGAVVFIANEKEEQHFLSDIRIKRGGKIKGEIYCMGNLELNGQVAGSVYTKYFISHIEGNVYLNYLYDAVINSYLLPNRAGGLLLSGEKRRVVKWLY